MHRRLLVPTVVAVSIAVAYGWAELVGYLWTDYEQANAVPLGALVHGDLATFFHAAPIEGPSLLLHAPFALTSWLWGGSSMAIYRMVAVPGLLAGVVLGVVLWALREERQPAARWSLLVVLLAAGNPLTLKALEIGHPEELLGAALCVGAVLAALWQRPWLAAVLLGLALANKAWAVLAIGPVLLALQGRRWTVFALACAIAAMFVAPFLLSSSSRASVLSAGGTDAVFQPWQIWWPLGQHGHTVSGFFGIPHPGYRVGPGWIAPVTHPLIAVLVVPATLLWRRRHGTGAASADVLLLLALLLLARCVLDVANNAYYHLPFLMALLAWEALQRKRPPVLSLAAASLVWLTVVKLPSSLSPDVQYIAYIAWALPALGLLAYAVYPTKRSVRTPARATSAPVAIQLPAR